MGVSGHQHVAGEGETLLLRTCHVQGSVIETGWDDQFSSLQPAII